MFSEKELLKLIEDASFFRVIRSEVEKMIEKKAEKIAEDDIEAIEELRELNRFNSDLGGGMGFDDLSERTKDRLVEEAGDDLENELEEVLSRDLFNIFTKIIRGIVWPIVTG